MLFDPQTKKVTSDTRLGKIKVYHVKINNSGYKQWKTFPMDWSLKQLRRNSQFLRF